jgi:hypothetical protein
VRAGSFLQGKLVLGNGHARLIFLAYVLIMHLLIFVVRGVLEAGFRQQLMRPHTVGQVLYKYSHTEDCHNNLAERCHQLQSHPAGHAVAHGVHFDSGELHDT